MCRKSAFSELYNSQFAADDSAPPAAGMSRERGIASRHRTVTYL
jgi:hypothetical protein